MRSKPVPEGTVPLNIDPQCSDVELLDTIVGHWHERLLASDERDVILSSLGLSLSDAEQLRIGICDRTLGLRLPDRRWKVGAAIRERLTDLGVMRGSGHESFRGCVVVPVIDSSGEVVAVTGRRIDRSAEVTWAEGLVGGLFFVNDPESTTVVVASVFEALAVVGAGHRRVVAPGRKKGFNEKDLAELAQCEELVILGRGNDDVVTSLEERSVSPSIAGSDVDLIMTLRAAPRPKDTLAALLSNRRTLGAGTTAADTKNSADDGPIEVIASEGRDEVFIHAKQRSWRVRGAGARANIEGDLLRVALSVSDRENGRFHLDTLDLYAARQRTAFLAATAVELRVDRESLAAELAEVLGVAERRRDEATSVGSPTFTLSDHEREEALEFLTSPTLLERVQHDLGALGVVGESTNLLTCYLATISRLCERPFGVAVQSSSAAGKSTVTDAVCSLVPPEDLVALSAITSQALYYLNSAGLSHKVLSIAEQQGASRASYPLKLLVSEGRLSIATTGKDRVSGRLATSSYEIEGPVALVLTTTASELDPELENRLVVLGVDEHAEQTRAILASQRHAASLAGLVARADRERLRTLHSNAQRLLRPYPVVIPEMTTDFPANATRHRRDHAKLLSIIAAITVLHQFQRDVKTAVVGDTTLTYLEASEDDISTGLELASRVLVRTDQHLAPQSARLFSRFLEFAGERAHEGGVELGDVGITRRELRETLGWSDTQVRSATDRLVALEYLVVSGGGRGRCRTYHYVPPIGEVRGPVAPVRPPRSRTSPTSLPGRTEEFVTFVGLGAPRKGKRPIVGAPTKERS